MRGALFRSPLTALVSGAALFALAEPALAEGFGQVFAQRVVLSAAQTRCRLLEPSAQQALVTATAQARAAAQRQGATDAALEAVAQRARTLARSLRCDDPGLRAAAANANSAFSAWRRTLRMRFPAGDAQWSVDRANSSAVRWRLVQSSTGGAFGVAGRLDAQAFVALAPQGAVPYAARLVLRDPAAAPRPWLNAPRGAPLPPRAATRSYLAEARAEADPALAPEGSAARLAFRFPAAVGEALAALDSRESFRVEFLYPDDRVAKIDYAVGDFAAARAFLALGPL